MTLELNPFDWKEFIRLWGPSRVFVARMSSVGSSASSLFNPAVSSLDLHDLTTEEQGFTESTPLIQDTILGIITHSLFDVELWVVPPTSLNHHRGPKTNKWLLEAVKRINNVFFMKTVRLFTVTWSEKSPDYTRSLLMAQLVGSALDEQAKQLFNAGLAAVTLISSQNRFSPAVTLDHADCLSSPAFFANSLSLFPIDESFKLEYLFRLSRIGEMSSTDPLAFGGEIFANIIFRTLYHPATPYQPSIVDRWQKWLRLPAMNQYVMQEVVEAGFDGGTVFKERLPIKVGIIGLIVILIGSGREDTNNARQQNLPDKVESQPAIEGLYRFILQHLRGPGVGTLRAERMQSWLDAITPTLWAAYESGSESWVMLEG